MAKRDYAIMVEPLSEADVGGWLATAIRLRLRSPMPRQQSPSGRMLPANCNAKRQNPTRSANGASACRVLCTKS